MDVSVALTTYNGGNYLSTQLDSILEQTRPPNEIIVCDDGSSDGTKNVLARYDEAYDKITVYENETSLGVTKNFEKAIKKCSCDLIALADQDDFWEPNKIQRQVHEYQRTDSNLICHDSLLVSSLKGATESIGDDLTLWQSLYHTHEPGADTPNLLYELIDRNFVQGATVLFDEELKEKALPIPKMWNHDYFLAILAVVSDGLYEIPESLLKYRQHEENDEGVTTNPVQKFRNQLQYEEEIYRDRYERWDPLLDRVEGIDIQLDEERIFDAIQRRRDHDRCRWLSNSNQYGRTTRIKAFGKNLYSGNYTRFEHPSSAVIDLFNLVF